MTPREAIKKFKAVLELPFVESALITDEAIKMAIEALEKQIAKTPTLEGDGYCPEGNLVYDTWFCPNCDKDYEVDYNDYDYCPNCGQKIDWSE